MVQRDPQGKRAAISRRALLGGAVAAGGAALATPRSASAAALSRSGSAPRRCDTRFGVNYVPSKNWWYCWMDWDADSILGDLRAIADLGFDHIRIQLLWPVFQPDPRVVNRGAVDHLRELLDIADHSSIGLDVQVTVLDGWLSGYDFQPAWRKDRPMLADSDMIAAELRLFEALAGAIGSHPRFLGFDLGNELDAINADVTPTVGDAWAQRLLKNCAEIAPGRFHVNGVDQHPWFEQRTFTQTQLATTGGASTFHTWVYWTGALERYGPNGTGSRHLGEYMAELVKAFHKDPSRTTWMQEFGASPTRQPAGSIPDFAESLVRNTMSSAHLWGWTWWASHDVDRRFSGFDPFEYQLGLLTTDNAVKPAGERLAALIRHWRRHPPVPENRTDALVLPDPTKAGLDFADRFFDLIDQGIRPAIVTADKADDGRYLAERGVTNLIRL